MLKSFLSVGSWTLFSRLTGFLRDILLALILGAGPLMDAFAVAFRLPNHFRAIFAEGAFNTAFVPAYTAARTTGGPIKADRFLGQILFIVLVAQGLLLAAALAFTGGLIDLLAPGFAERPQVRALAIELTRLTFPYLALVTLVTVWAGVLNAEKRFVAGAAAPVLLNLAMMGALALSGWFPTPAHAAAAGVLVAGLLEAGLLWWGARRSGLTAAPRLPKREGELAAFFKAFGPAVVGSAGVQLAMLADTILVTFLAPGGASALYYADRLYQLPIGVIAVAAGTVLLPEMSRRIAAGDEAGARLAQNQTLGLTLLVAMPFFVAFLLVPHAIVAGMFERGAFDAAATERAAMVLFAYAIGLPAVVSIRSAVASFYARGDTATPLYASLTAIACNLALKLLLWRHLDAAGLALATAVGAWINLVIVVVLAMRRGHAAPDRRLACLALAAAAGGLSLAAVLLLLAPAAPGLIEGWLAPSARHLRAEVTLLVLALAGALAYGLPSLAALRMMRVPLRR